MRKATTKSIGRRGWLAVTSLALTLAFLGLLSIVATPSYVSGMGGRLSTEGREGAALRRRAVTGGRC